MDAADQAHQPLLDNFKAITSSTPEVAAFFLESHNWDLEAALHSFYDDPQPQIQPQSQAQDQAQDEAQNDDNDDDDDDYLPSEDEAPAPAVNTRVKRGEKRPASGRSNIRGFGDLNRSPGESDDDDDEERQEYYTGGEKSGMLVQDPSKGNNSVDSIFDEARQQAVAPYQPSSSSRSFTGTARTLAGDTVAAPAQPPENIVHNIYLWTNGFTVDDGPLRRFDDPANVPFLESIRKSECPKELEPADRRTKVRVNLVRKEEKYRRQEPGRRSGAFQGVGRTLGSGETSDATEATAPSAAAPSQSPSPFMGLTVDDSRPCTSIQLRLADGTRMVARFNTSHTISDIRAFIDASRPGARTYQLQTVGFPPLQLNDLTKTIEEAGLSNSVVIQKL